MIRDKIIYQNRLRQIYNKINNIIKPMALYDSRHLDFEELIFTSAFLMRKLFEDHKISNEMMSTNLPVLQYSMKKNRFIDALNNHLLDANYEMSQSTQESIKLKYLLNQLVHSLVFEMSINCLGNPEFDLKFTTNLRSLTILRIK